MKALALAAALVVLALTPAAHGQDKEEDTSSPKLRIAWADFKALYDTGKLTLVDVRDADSFLAGHIPGARSIPLGDVEANAAALKRTGRPIVLYCA